MAKIELTRTELKSLIDEVFAEGFSAGESESYFWKKHEAWRSKIQFYQKFGIKYEGSKNEGD